jgi:hypothetical protein
VKGEPKGRPWSRQPHSPRAQPGVGGTHAARVQRVVGLAFGAVALVSALVGVYYLTLLALNAIPSHASALESLNWSLTQAVYSSRAEQSLALGIAFGLLSFLFYPVAGRSPAARGGWPAAFAISYPCLVLSIVSYGFVFTERAGPLRWPASVIFLTAQYLTGPVQSPAPIFYHMDAMYAVMGIAAFASSWVVFRSFWRALQLLSAALTLLPTLIFAFDRKEFGIQFANFLVPLGLGWFTNEYLLFAGVAAVALSTIFGAVARRSRPRAQLGRRGVAF